MGGLVTPGTSAASNKIGLAVTEKTRNGKVGTTVGRTAGGERS